MRNSRGLPCLHCFHRRTRKRHREQERVAAREPSEVFVHSCATVCWQMKGRPEFLQAQDPYFGRNPESSPRHEAIVGIYCDMALLEDEVKDTIKKISEECNPMRRPLPPEESWTNRLCTDSNSSQKFEARPQTGPAAFFRTFPAGFCLNRAFFLAADATPGSFTHPGRTPGRN